LIDISEKLYSFIDCKSKKEGTVEKENSTSSFNNTAG
jgi:hypothetical protein